MRSFLRRNAWRSGAGICDLGLHWAGLKHQWFCEIDPFCRSILARHWPDVPIYNDVAALEAYNGPIVCRVDDGGAAGMDRPRGAVPGREHKLGRVDLATARQWIPRLKALGNAITPQQAYAIAACILEAEGMDVPPMP